MPVIDCSDVRSEREFWDAYIRAAEPEGAEFFGRNLDAFWDALQGGPGGPAPRDLRFVGTAHLADLRDGTFLRALQRIAHESAWVNITLE